MPNVKLTKRAVEKHQPGERDIILWDTDLKGFACKITPKGEARLFGLLSNPRR